MKRIASHELKRDPRKVWEFAGDEWVVITSNDRPVAILRSVEGCNADQVMQEYDAFLAYSAARRMHERSAQLGNASLDLKKINGAIRRARGKSQAHRAGRS